MDKVFLFWRYPWGRCLSSWSRNFYGNTKSTGALRNAWISIEQWWSSVLLWVQLNCKQVKMSVYMHHGLRKRWHQSSILNFYRGTKNMGVKALRYWVLVTSDFFLKNFALNAVMSECFGLRHLTRGQKPRREETVVEPSPGFHFDPWPELLTTYPIGLSDFCKELGAFRPKAKPSEFDGGFSVGLWFAMGLLRVINGFKSSYSSGFMGFMVVFKWSVRLQKKVMVAKCLHKFRGVWMFW